MGENPRPFEENLCSHHCLQVCLKQPWGTAAVAQHRGISALTVVLPTERWQLCSSESLLRSLWFWGEVPAGLGCKEVCLCLSFGLSIGGSCCKQGMAWGGFRGWGWLWHLQSMAGVAQQWAWNPGSSAAVVWRLQIQTRRWNKTCFCLASGMFCLASGCRCALWAVCRHSLSVLLPVATEGDGMEVQPCTLQVWGLVHWAWSWVPWTIASLSSPKIQALVIAPPLFYHILTITTLAPGISWVLMTSWG